MRMMRNKNWQVASTSILAAGTALIAAFGAPALAEDTSSTAQALEPPSFIAANFFDPNAKLSALVSLSEDERRALFTPLRLDANDLHAPKLGGPGANELRLKIENAQFVLFGEDHGFEDSGQLAHGLAQIAIAQGFDHLVLEIGPLSADWVAGRLRRGGVNGLAKALEGQGFAVPFVNAFADAALTNRFRSKGALWGVDQEFVGSSLIHLRALRREADGRGAKVFVDELIAREEAAIAARNENEFFLFAVRDVELARLERYFSAQPDAAKVVEALKISAQIYRQYGEGQQYASDEKRIALMRANFLRAYHAQKSDAPKVFLKLGAAHAGRGTTPSEMFDLGSLTEGIAASNQMDVLRVAFMPVAGRQLNIHPAPDGFYRESDYNSLVMEELLAALDIDEALIPAEGYALMSMEPVRRALESGGLAQLSARTRFMVLGFDYLITTRSARSSAPLAQ